MSRRMKHMIATALIFLSISVSLLNRVEAENAESYDVIQELKLFSRAIGAVMEGYVESLDARQLLYRAVEGMLTNLDPYTTFIDEEQYEFLQIDMKGEYSGLGAVLGMDEDQIIIKEVKPESAAEIAGLFELDAILKVDGQLTAGKTIAEVAGWLRGEVDTQAVVTILRATIKEPFDVKITRKIVEISAVNDIRMAGRRLGYIRIDNFQENTPQQIDDALDELESKGMKALIIDLRNNQGGLMSVAIQLAERFLDEGKEIVSVESRIDVQRKKHLAAGENPPRTCKLIVLVNERSASASEIFSAAIQDHGRGLILGEKTFGKASVQSIVPLDDKTAIKLTTARYISPNGRVIDKVGIEPDEKVPYHIEGDEGEDQQIRKALELFKKYQ